MVSIGLPRTLIEITYYKLDSNPIFEIPSQLYFMLLVVLEFWSSAAWLRLNDLVRAQIGNPNGP